MKLHHLLVLVVLGGFVAFAFAVGCSTENPMASAIGQSSGESVSPTKKKAAVKKKTKRKATRVFKSRMKGAGEVPPVETPAFGLGHVSYRSDELGGMEFDYSLIVKNLEHITGAHLHYAPEGENGRIVAPLYRSETTDGVDADGTTGLLVSGVIREEDLVEFQITADELAAYLREDQIYVNVHTLAHPSGEIRGQLKEVDQTPLKKVKRIPVTDD